MDKSILESVDGYWQVQRNAMEIEYNKLRDNLMFEIQRYYRQSVYNNYVTEDAIIKKLEELKNLKKCIQDFSNANRPSKVTCSSEPTVTQEYDDSLDKILAAV